MSVTRCFQAWRLLWAVFILLWPVVAQAQSCSFGVSNMAFGSVDTLSGAQTNSTAAISVNCSGTPLARILICPNLNQGSGGATSTARQMLNGANILNYQLYSDSARSIVWGSYSWPYPSRAPALALTLGVLGTGSGSATIYGTVFGGQVAAPPGAYLSTFSGSNVEFRYRYTTTSTCTTGTGTVARPTFQVTGTISANCLVATQNVDFGTTGVLDANIDATGTVSVTCTPSTVYTIALNGGTTGSPPTSRKMSKGSETVTYGLYKDSARTQPWGDAGTPGSTVSGNGSGASQNFTVYGRVPPQPTPSPGVYTDTVIVTVTY